LRHFRCSNLKPHKLSKSKGKVEYAYHCSKCADAVYPKLSKFVRACRNYSLSKLARFLRYSVYFEQDAQLSQRDRVVLHVVEYYTKSLKVIETGTTRKPGYGFLFAFHSNYGAVGSSCIISEIKRDIGRKSRFFHTLLHLTPPFVGARQNIAIPFGTEKPE